MSVSPLGDLLVSIGLITEDDRRTIIRECGRASQSFAKSIIRLGIVHERDLPELINKRSGARKATKEDLLAPTKEALSLIDRNLMAKLEVLPLRTEMGRLLIAMADPLDRDTVSQVQFFARRPVVALVANFSEIKSALAGHLGGTFTPSVPPLTAFLDRHKERIGANSALAIEDDEEELIIAPSNDDLDFEPPKAIASPSSIEKVSKNRESFDKPSFSMKKSSIETKAPSSLTAPKKDKSFGVELLDDLTTLEESEEASSQVSDHLEMISENMPDTAPKKTAFDSFEFDSDEESQVDFNDNFEEPTSNSLPSKSKPNKTDSTVSKRSFNKKSISKLEQITADTNIDDIDTTGLGDDLEFPPDELEQNSSTQTNDLDLGQFRENPETELDSLEMNEELDSREMIEEPAGADKKKMKKNSTSPRNPSNRKRAAKPSLGLDEEILDFSQEQSLEMMDSDFESELFETTDIDLHLESQPEKSTNETKKAQKPTNNSQTNIQPLASHSTKTLQATDETDILLEDLDESPFSDKNNEAKTPEIAPSFDPGLNDPSFNLEEDLNFLEDDSSVFSQRDTEALSQELMEADLGDSETHDSNHLSLMNKERSQDILSSGRSKRSPENLEMDFELDSEMPQKNSKKELSRDAEKLDVINFGDDLEDELGVSLSLDASEKSFQNSIDFDDTDLNPIPESESSFEEHIKQETPPENKKDQKNIDPNPIKKHENQATSKTKIAKGLSPLENAKHLQSKEIDSLESDESMLNESMEMNFDELNEVSIFGSEPSELADIPISSGHLEESIDSSPVSHFDSKAHQAMAAINHAVTSLMAVDTEKEAHECIVSAMRAVGAKTGFWIQMGSTSNGIFWDESQTRSTTDIELKLISPQNSSTWQKFGKMEGITLLIGETKIKLAAAWDPDTTIQLKNNVIPIFKALVKLQIA
jgi:hypothetical protein